MSRLALIATLLAVASACTRTVDVGAMLRPGGTVTGRAAIREQMSPALRDPSFTYLTIWKKQPDGSWKDVLDTGVEDPPPEVTAAH